jgi:glycerol-3-phosphate dehydrogenase subunit B
MGHFMPTEEIKCDLLVIGSGLAGMAASLFAASRDIDTLQVGHASELVFSTGLLDLLGVHPIGSGRVWDDPWAGIGLLIRDMPMHPYGRLGKQRIRDAMEEFVAFMTKAGHAYVMHPDRNVRVIMPLGTLKTTYAVPESMAAGVEALGNQIPTLMVDFQGLKGYSSRQITKTLGDRWPSLRAVTIPFPGMSGELYSEQMARSLETGDTRKRLAESLRVHLGDAQAVALPAVLGVSRTQEILKDLESDLGLPVFEIPTMVPGVTGLRLREVFERHLPDMGVRTLYYNRVTDVAAGDGSFRLQVGSDFQSSVVSARAVVLASGRFLGKGLHAERTRVRESIFDLPVHQPAHRDQWHHKDFLHPEGHLINRAGVMVDDDLRPVDENRQVIYPNLFAAGSILAHQDWMRQKCGSGLAISTAYGAIKAYQKLSASE